MATPPLATPSDLGVWLGQTIATDDARATALLSGASALVRAYVGRTWLTDDDPPVLTDDVPDAVNTVVVQVASRVWVNPQSLVRADGGDAPGRQWSPDAANGLYLTDDEKSILDGPGIVLPNRSGLWTLRTYRDDPCADTVYVPVEGGAPDFPWYSTDDIPFT